MLTGIVSQLQDFSIHDGDGIRTTVFLSGCPLRCRWCSNPETWSCRPAIAVHAQRCTDCGRCLAACPVERALSPAAPHYVDPARCTLCGKCVEACLSGARTLMGSEMSVEDVVDRVLRHKIFFQASGGGVTFSGGEATYQTEFFNALVDAFYDLGIHMTLETSGYFNWDAVAASLSRMDLIFADIKHMDPQMHLKATGQDNRLILENLRKLGALGVDVIVRIPVIPDVNDTDENIRLTALFVREALPGALIELLPYHGYGAYKFEALDLLDQSDTYETPAEDALLRMKQIITDCGVGIAEYN